jgi:hypothetical protein
VLCALPRPRCGRCGRWVSQGLTEKLAAPRPVPRFATVRNCGWGLGPPDIAVHPLVELVTCASPPAPLLLPTNAISVPRTAVPSTGTGRGGATTPHPPREQYQERPSQHWCPYTHCHRPGHHDGGHGAASAYRDRPRRSRDRWRLAAAAAARARRGGGGGGGGGGGARRPRRRARAARGRRARRACDARARARRGAAIRSAAAARDTMRDQPKSIPAGSPRGIYLLLPAGCLLRYRAGRHGRMCMSIVIVALAAAPPAEPPPRPASCVWLMAAVPLLLLLLGTSGAPPPCPARPCPAHPGRTFCPSITLPGQCDHPMPHPPCPPCRVPGPPLPPPPPPPPRPTHRPWLNATLPIPQRVSLLMAQMTLEEKMLQLVMADIRWPAPGRNDRWNQTAKVLALGGWGATAASGAAVGPPAASGDGPGAEVGHGRRSGTTEYVDSTAVCSPPGGAECRIGALRELQLAFLNHTRLGIPVSFVEETSHAGGAGSTIFPMGVTQGATWNVTLAHEIGRAIALEARSWGIDRGLSPEINVCNE